MNFNLTFFTIWVLALQLNAQHINGLTIVGTPDSFSVNPYPRIAETQANWICLVPYGFTRMGDTALHYNLERQWWGEKRKGLVENIKLARAQGLKIFLKPQVYIPGSWPGQLDYEDSDWLIWEKNYKAFINFYLDIAIEYDIEMFCVGTEFKVSEQKRKSFWRSLIKDLRCKYAGDLCYSSNWDSYNKVPFWDLLDFVGISSYFPLSSKKLPKEKELNKAWKAKIAELKAFSQDQGKPILFTEYGYLSVDGCTGKTWELEKNVNSLNINQKAQANAFEALYKNLWEEEFWAGGFIWKWFPNDQGHEGYIPRDYTPKNKLAEDIIKEWFSKDTDSE